MEGGGRGEGGNNPAKLQERDSSSTANNAPDTLCVCVCVYTSVLKKREGFTVGFKTERAVGLKKNIKEWRESREWYLYIEQ